jgi:hypothetical protein
MTNFKRVEDVKESENSIENVNIATGSRPVFNPQLLFATTCSRSLGPTL